MKCQFCDNPATVHLTEIIHKKKHEAHLCEECAREHNLFPDAQQELNVPALLQFLKLQVVGGTIAKSDQNGLTCPHCGIKYAQFRAQGRLGCPEDYDVFRAVLEPLLERIHRNIRHAGKTPRRHGVRLGNVEKQDLLSLLQAAVREERFEDAARLRDQIRSMGTADES
jgi:protein arginine kinase activator